MPEVVDLHGAALLIGCSYDTLQRNWRAWHTANGFPWPHIGGHRGGRPKWATVKVVNWRDGTHGAACVATLGNDAQPVSTEAAANDVRPIAITDRVANLLRLAGG